MSSGNRSVLIALLERADPTDITKLQALLAQHTGEIARWLTASKLAGAFYSYPGMASAYAPAIDPTVPSDEVAHACLSGLLIRPTTTYLAVDPGAAAFYQPARAGLSATDDTPWIFGFSAGLNDAAQLTFQANAGPGIRWDIVECQVAADTVESQAGREIFDPVGNVFNPQTVDKIQHSVFTFRIRRGTQGAGIPPIDPDWMPLCAVHVRTDSTSYDNSDLYDIRPLVTERTDWGTRHPISAPSSGACYKSVLHEAEMRSVVNVGVNGALLEGYFRGHFGGYWSGGEIRTNLPATSLSNFGATGVSGASLYGFNFEAAAMRSGAFALAANAVLTLGAFFPRGYPRWVRYSQAPLAADATTRLRVGGRFPEGPRGLLMVLNGADGGGLVKRNGVIAPATLPAAVGETTGAWGHVVQYALVDGAGTGVRPAEGDAQSNLYSWQVYTVFEGGALTPNITAIANPAGPSVAADLDGATQFALQAIFTPGSGRVPASASAVQCSLLLGVTVAAAGQYSQVAPGVAYQAVNGYGRAVPGLGMSEFTNDGGGPTNAVNLYSFLMPLTPNITYGSVGAPEEMRLALNYVGAGLSAPGATTLIHGYRL